jgi:hypothetical protein
MIQQLAAAMAFVLLNALVRRAALTRWRDGRLSMTRASVIVAGVWATFPFFGLAAGAPWSLALVLFGSLLSFISVLVAACLILPHVHLPHQGASVGP